MVQKSPVRSQRDGELSKSPVRDSFLSWQNVKQILLTLFGAHAGVSVVWYTGQFYVLFFLINTLKVPFTEAYTIVAAALLIGCPFIVFFGWLSDRLGRKWIILAGCALASVTMFPIFSMMTQAANPKLVEFQKNVEITVSGQNCNFNLFAAPSSDCDRARDLLTKAGVTYRKLPPTSNEDLVVKVGDIVLKGFSEAAYRDALRSKGYSAKADLQEMSAVKLILLISVLMVFVAMVYGPVAAFFVEAFPARIRYTSLSFSYHLGAGWFGGFAPFISTALALEAGNIYAGLWYPVLIAGLTVLIGAIWLPETKQRSIA